MKKACLYCRTAQSEGLKEIMEIAKPEQVDMILAKDISRINRNNSFDLDLLKI